MTARLADRTTTRTSRPSAAATPLQLLLGCMAVSLAGMALALAAGMVAPPHAAAATPQSAVTAVPPFSSVIPKGVGFAAAGGALFQVPGSGDELVWARGLGGVSNDEGNSVVVDGSGNVITGGTFQGTVDFDPGPGVFFLTSSSLDAFVSKFDSGGGLVWARSFGGTSVVGADSVAVDAAGNVIIAGSFSGTADFDPGPGVSNLTAAGGPDVFVSKLDANGGFVWARRFGGAATDKAFSVAVDASDNVITTGLFRGLVDFDPGPQVVNLSSAGGDDVFVSKLDSNGDFVWARRLGAAGGDWGGRLRSTDPTT